MLETDFSTFKRGRDRGSHDRQLLYDILDATPICHVGYVTGGRPVVTPTCHWRDGNRLFWHGSRLSRTLVAGKNAEVCVTVTLLDGLVLARSAFHHSANYRSAMVFGRPTAITDNDEKRQTLQVFIDGLFANRWQELREVTQKELDATTVLCLPIEEGSAKVRKGPPNDAAGDLAHPVWAGVIPMTTVTGEPVASPDLAVDIKPASYTGGANR